MRLGKHLPSRADGHKRQWDNAGSASSGTGLERSWGRKNLDRRGEEVSNDAQDGVDLDASKKVEGACGRSNRRLADKGLPRRHVWCHRWHDGQGQSLGRAAKGRRDVVALKGRVTVSVLEAGDDGRVASLQLGVDEDGEASVSSAARPEQRVAVGRSTRHSVSGSRRSGQEVDLRSAVDGAVTRAVGVFGTAQTVAVVVEGRAAAALDVEGDKRPGKVSQVKRAFRWKTYCRRA